MHRPALMADSTTPSSKSNQPIGLTSVNIRTVCSEPLAKMTGIASRNEKRGGLARQAEKQAEGYGDTGTRGAGISASTWKQPIIKTSFSPSWYSSRWRSARVSAYHSSRPKRIGSGGQHPRLAQLVLDRALQQETGNDRGQGADDHPPRKQAVAIARRRRSSAARMDHAPHLGAEVVQNRDQRTEMHGDVEHQPLVRPAE